MLHQDNVKFKPTGERCLNYMYVSGVDFVPRPRGHLSYEKTNMANCNELYAL